MLILDLETDSLMPYCTKIHCAVGYHIEKNEWHYFTPKNIHELSEFLDTQDSISMHNGIGFDLKVLKKIFNYEYKGKYRDTLMMSRVLWPDLSFVVYKNEKGEEKKAKNPHSIESWGLRFEIQKPEHEDWSRFSDDMLYRCQEDVKIQTRLYLHCLEHIERLKNKDPRLKNWDKIFNMEQYFWKSMEEQADYGWLFNVDLADFWVNKLEKELQSIDDKLEPYLPVLVKTPYGDKPCKALKQNGELTTHALKWFETASSNIIQSSDVVGDFSRVKYEKVDLNSPVQLKDFLMFNGWEPKEYNYKKDRFGKIIKDAQLSPKTPSNSEEWESLAEQMNNPVIELLADRGKKKHRFGQIKGLIKNVRPDRRIEAQMNSCGTNTARVRHKIVVNIPKANDKVYLGKEIRDMFIVPYNKVLVGCDASALEARCEAHYVYQFSKEAALELIEGDIHTKNMFAFEIDNRDRSKSGKYAILYGCSPYKLANVLDKPTSEAQRIYNAYWDANPALKRLNEALKRQWKDKGYLVSIDGRPLSIRYEHALLNTLLQSCGAIAMKTAFCIFWGWAKAQSYHIKSVGNFHDEMQIECVPEIADYVGQTLVNSIKRAGEILKLNVPLTGEYKIGQSWAKTH